MAYSPLDNAASSTRSRWGLRALLCVLTLAAGSVAAAILPDRNLPISLDADSSELDRRNNLVTFTNVQVTQGEVGVAADRARATGLDFENSRWEFSGHVTIQLPSGSITAEAATVEFADHELRIATITGDPASFEHRDAAAERLARGRARQIVYDVRAGTVTLQQDAWLSEADNEISGNLLVYNIAEERVLANGGAESGERVRVRIVPRPNDEGSSENAPPDQLPESRQP